MPIYPAIGGGGGGSIGGASGSTDNAVIRADGTGGSTIQSSLVIVSDAGDVTTPGGMCFGNSASIGTSGGMTRLNDISNTVTDFSGSPSWRHTANRFILNSSANTTATANTLLNQISTDPASTTNFGVMVCGSFVAQHLGSGNVTTISGFGITATNGNSGTVTTNSAMIVNSYNASSGTITTNNGLILQTGSFSASGTVGTNKALVIKTPYTTGTLSTHYGVYIEDQTAGGTGYAIYSAGGRSYHNGNFGFGLTPTVQVDILNEARVTTSNLVGALINIETTSFGGGLWKLVSSGAADVSGAGNFQITDYTNATTPFVIYGFGTGAGNVIHARNSRFSETYSASSVSSSGTLTLNEDGNSFTITGTATIDRIETNRWIAGSIINLVFTGAATLNHNSATVSSAVGMLLAGSANQLVTAGSVFSFLYDGTNWHEISRKIA